MHPSKLKTVHIYFICRINSRINVCILLHTLPSLESLSTQFTSNAIRWKEIWWTLVSQQAKHIQRQKHRIKQQQKYQNIAKRTSNILYSVFSFHRSEVFHSVAHMKLMHFSKAITLLNCDAKHLRWAYSQQLSQFCKIFMFELDSSVSVAISLSAANNNIRVHRLFCQPMAADNLRIVLCLLFIFFFFLFFLLFSSHTISLESSMQLFCSEIQTSNE